MAKEVCVECQKKPAKCKGRCPACYQRHRLKTDPEFKARQLAATLDWQRRHPEKVASYRRTSGRAYARKNPQQRGYRYGITLEQANAMYARGCDLCGTKERPCIDHDHQTGKVRGTLCLACNFALNSIERGPDWIAQAQAYLANPPGVDS